MERTGFAIDVPYLNAQHETAIRDRDTCLADLALGLAKCGVPPLPGTDDLWASPKQLVALLHDSPLGLKLPPSPFWFKGKVDVAGGERKTDRTALDHIVGHLGVDDPRRQVVECLATLRRILSSAKYLGKLPKYVGPDGFVHPVTGPAGDEDDRVGAITGRFGMKNPEGQQIPKDKKKDRYNIRRAFIAPPGELLVVRDYTALEVVIFANICEWLFGDTQLLDLTGPGQDIHAHNAYLVFGKFLDWRTDSGRRIAGFEAQELYKSDPELAWYRDLIKAVWYKLQYGGTVFGFANSLKDRHGNPIGKTRAQEIVDALYGAVPCIPKWQDFVGNCLRRDRGICALDGRFVDYGRVIDMGDWGFSAACRGAQNLPMQGTGAHVVGCAMVEANECPELRRLGAKLQLQIHDEIQWRCPGDNAATVGGLTGEIMDSAFPLKNLRTSLGIGEHWAACK